MNHDALSQEEIDRLFQDNGGVATKGDPAESATAYDFRRPDRIPKDQLRAIHLSHDFLARNLASSLGAYLRAYVTVNLVSVEQLAFGEFLGYLPTPTCIANVAMRPTEGNAVLELNPSLVTPLLDIVLGGTGEEEADESRELTEIEQSIMETIFRIILNDLREAWTGTSDLSFEVEDTETQPQLVQILSPNEAVVGIGFEVTVGKGRGMMNFGLPSVIVKMMGQRLEQQWSIRRRSTADEDRRRMSAMVRRAPVGVEARVEGGGLKVRDLLSLQPSDVISLGVPVSRPAKVRVNHVPKFEGAVVAAGRTRAVRLGGGGVDRGDGSEPTRTASP